MSYVFSLAPFCSWCRTSSSNSRTKTCLVFSLMRKTLSDFLLVQDIWVTRVTDFSLNMDKPDGHWMALMRCCFMFASQFIGWAATLLMVSRSCKHKQKRRRIKPKRCRFVACEKGAAVVAPETARRSDSGLVSKGVKSFGIILYYLVFLLFVNLNAWSYAMILLASNQSASSFSDVIKRRKVTLCLAMKVWEGEGSESQRLFSLCSQYSVSFSCNSYSSCLLQSVWILTLWEDLAFLWTFWTAFETGFVANCVLTHQIPWVKAAAKPIFIGVSDSIILWNAQKITWYRSRLRFQRPRFPALYHEIKIRESGKRL